MAPRRTQEQKAARRVPPDMKAARKAERDAERAAGAAARADGLICPEPNTGCWLWCGCRGAIRLIANGKNRRYVSGAT